MQLTVAQVRRVETALTRIADDSQYGELRLIVEKGRLRRIQTVQSEWIEEPEPAAAAHPPGRRPAP